MTVPPSLGADVEARRARSVLLDPASTASEAFVVVAHECIDHWRTNEALLRGSRAMPHLHQTRVGIRRLRSAFSLFRPLLADVPGAFVVAHRLRGLALAFGTARDLDVVLSGPLVDDLDDDQVTRLAAEREAAYDVVQAVIGSTEWADAAGAVDGLVLLAPWPAVGDPPVRGLAATSLDKRWRRVTRHVDRLTAMDPHNRHRVRIEAKKLRYGCEFFASLYEEPPGDGATAGGAAAAPAGDAAGDGEELSAPLAFARQVEQVQTALGALNDHATADGLLRSVGSAAPRVDEHRLVREAVEEVRALAALDPFWH